MLDVKYQGVSPFSLIPSIGERKLPAALHAQRRGQFRRPMQAAERSPPANHKVNSSKLLDGSLDGLLQAVRAAHVGADAQALPPRALAERRSGRGDDVLAAAQDRRVGAVCRRGGGGDAGGQCCAPGGAVDERGTYEPSRLRSCRSRCHFLRLSRCSTRARRQHPRPGQSAPVGETHNATLPAKMLSLKMLIAFSIEWVLNGVEVVKNWERGARWGRGLGTKPRRPAARPRQIAGLAGDLQTGWPLRRGSDVSVGGIVAWVT